MDRPPLLCVNYAPGEFAGSAKIKQLKNYLVVILAIAVLMVMAISASTLYQSYQQTRQSAVSNASNVTLVSQRAISRNLEMLSLSLDTLAYRFQHPLSARRLNDAQRYAYLFGSTTNVSHIAVMAVLDAGARVQVSSRLRRGNGAPHYADRAYFIAHRDSPTVGLYVSRPMQASLGNELQVVVLSKRLSNEDGSFAGVVVMALDLAYFRELFEGLALGDEGIISLYSDEGIAYMRVPYRETIIGRDISQTGNFQRLRAMLSEEEGSFFAYATNDGVRRLYTFRRIPGSPLIVFVGYAEEAIFKTWRKTFYAVLVSLAIFGLLTVWLLLHVRQELRRRVNAERQLEALARTDGLTGLLNRPGRSPAGHLGALPAQSGGFLLGAVHRRGLFQGLQRYLRPQAGRYRAQGSGRHPDRPAAPPYRLRRSLRRRGIRGAAGADRPARSADDGAAPVRRGPRAPHRAHLQPVGSGDHQRRRGDAGA